MEITYMDQELLQIFDQLPNQKIATVHSIFDKVVNLLAIDEYHLLTIALEEVIQAPKMMKISKDDFSKLKISIKIGDPVFLQEGQIIMGSVQLNYSEVDLWNGKIPVNKKFTPVNGLVNLKEKDSGLLSAWLKFSDGVEFQNENAYAQPLYERLQNFEVALQCSCPDEIREASRNFIGLGPGLTPSGDDFMLGCLTTWQCLDDPVFQVYQAKDWLDSIKGQTTTVSYHMLKEGLGGFVNDALIGFLSGRDQDSARFQEIGATSGLDMLIGVLFASRYSEV